MGVQLYGYHNHLGIVQPIYVVINFIKSQPNSPWIAEARETYTKIAKALDNYNKITAFTTQDCI